MSKRYIKNIVISLLLMYYTILYKTIIFNNLTKYSELINISFLAIIVALSLLFFGYRFQRKTIIDTKLLKIVLLDSILFIVILFGIGIFSGFLQNGFSLKILSLVDNIFGPVFTIIFIELIRYIVISANKSEKMFIYFFTTVLILFEITTSVRVIYFNDPELFFRVLTTVILPIIVKNYVLSYLIINTGYKTTIIYRLITELYIYVSPIIPNVSDYINSVISIALPLHVFLCASNVVKDHDMVDRKVKINNKNNFGNLLLYTAIVVVAALMSGFFPYHMIGVGSESMEPIINKGDAVIVHKINDSDIIEVGDVVAFQDNNKIIIHRINKIDYDSNTYYTRGDANNMPDSKGLKRNEIIGTIKMRIPYIAWPSIFLCELFG